MPAADRLCPDFMGPKSADALRSNMAWSWLSDALLPQPRHGKHGDCTALLLRTVTSILSTSMPSTSLVSSSGGGRSSPLKHRSTVCSSGRSSTSFTKRRSLPRL